MRILNLRRKRTLVSLIITGFIGAVSVIEIVTPQIGKAENPSEITPILTLPIIQGNSIMAFSSPSQPLKPAQKVKMVITAYSSTPGETDNDPFITASGSKVKDGVVANNLLPFGTKIRIPELYGDRVFTVQDRMNWRKSYYHIDIWFSSYNQAKKFGAKSAYIEILES